MVESERYQTKSHNGNPNNLFLFFSPSFSLFVCVYVYTFRVCVEVLKGHCVRRAGRRELAPVRAADRSCVCVVCRH